MIKINETAVPYLVVASVQGLHDFTALKTLGQNWPGYDYTEALSTKLYYQYEPRTFSVECFTKAANWAELQSRLNDISHRFKYDNNQLLTFPGISARGYVARLVKPLQFLPVRIFGSGTSVARYRLTFEEPHPFNVQFAMKFDEPALLEEFTVLISRGAYTAQKFSFRNKMIQVNFRNFWNQYNIEDENLELTFSFSPVAGQIYPFVISGDVDQVTGITISATQQPLFKTSADAFLRSGAITFNQL